MCVERSAAMAYPRDHGVDDELRDPKHRQRHERANESQADARNHQRRTRFPDQFEQGPDVAEGVEASLPRHVLGLQSGPVWRHQIQCKARPRTLNFRGRRALM